MTRLFTQRKDANHAEIKSALVNAGCLVADLSDASGGVPDLLVLRRLADGTELWRLLELKTKRGRMRKAQEAFAKQFPVSVVKTAAEALTAMGIEVGGE
jgi:hypothetical protein